MKTPLILFMYMFMHKKRPFIFSITQQLFCFLLGEIHGYFGKILYIFIIFLDKNKILWYYFKVLIFSILLKINGRLFSAV